MAFWNSEKLLSRLPSRGEEPGLITPFCEKQVVRSAYQLAMGPEAFITSAEDNTRDDLEAADEDGHGAGVVAIPPGQFALLLTEEVVTIPADAIAFISLRYSFKKKGLVNVSGFHVDPGFHGRLKFSVFNAGSSTLRVTRGDRLFLIWYADLNAPTEDLYREKQTWKGRITSTDQDDLQGAVASPAELQREIDSLKSKDTHRKWILGVLALSAVGIFFRLLFMEAYSVPSSADIDRLREDVLREVRQDIRAGGAETRRAVLAVESGSSLQQIDDVQELSDAP